MKSLNQKLYEANKEAAEKINKIDEKMGFYALRKVEHTTPNTALEILIQVGEEITMIAEMVA